MADLNDSWSEENQLLTNFDETFVYESHILPNLTLDLSESNASWIESHNCTSGATCCSFLGCRSSHLQLTMTVAKALVLSCMALLTIAGNTLVLLAVFMSRSLRSSTHYLIVNLAVADLLLGTAVLPFSIVLEVSGSWMFGPVFCDVWAAVDVLCCTASIWSLCVISIDRYVGVTKPLGYNTIITKRRVGVLMAGVWALSVAVSIVPMFGWQKPTSGDPYVCTVNTQTGYVLFSVVVSFYLPGFCIVVLYWRIFRTACRQSRFLESGTKTTGTSVTLRIHKGCPQRQDSTKMTLRVNRGGSLPSSTHNLAVSGSHLENIRRCSENYISPADSTLRSGKKSDRKASSQLEVHSRGLQANHWQKNNRMSNYLQIGTRWPSGNTLHSFNFQSASTSRCSSISSTDTRIGTAHTGRMAKFQRQQKAAKTLGIVVGVFLLCWFPFFFILPLDTLCLACQVPDAVFGAFFWLGYFNSCLNPFIYACTSKHFKRAFQRILCRKKWHKKRALASAASCRNNSTWSKRTSTGNIAHNVMASSSHSSNDTAIKSVSTSNVQLNMIPSINFPSPDHSFSGGRACSVILRSAPNLNSVDKLDDVKCFASHQHRSRGSHSCIPESGSGDSFMRSDELLNKSSHLKMGYDKANTDINSRRNSDFFDCREGINKNYVNLDGCLGDERDHCNNGKHARKVGSMHTMNCMKGIAELDEDHRHLSSSYPPSLNEHVFANSGRSSIDFSDIPFADSSDDEEALFCRTVSNTMASGSLDFVGSSIYNSKDVNSPETNLEQKLRSESLANSQESIPGMRRPAKLIVETHVSRNGSVAGDCTMESKQLNDIKNDSNTSYQIYFQYRGNS
ncbi:G protein-coupled receptor rhodopsin-like [Trinorchestia longiramus]|nr:G protein-coupled receptor rhodopsin-like [Trinorchestia longiramus]